MPIKIVAKKNGFRRAGVVHQGTVYYDDGFFSDAQLALLQAEPKLDVSIIDDRPEPAAEEAPAEEAPAEEAPAEETPAKPKKGKK